MDTVVAAGALAVAAPATPGLQGEAAAAEAGEGGGEGGGGDGDQGGGRRHGRLQVGGVYCTRPTLRASWTI